jgi:hypothetical protein
MFSIMLLDESLGYNAKLLGRLPADGNIRVPPLDVAIQRERPENHLHFCVILKPAPMLDESE